MSRSVSLKRLNDYTSQVLFPQEQACAFEAHVYTNEEVFIDRASVDELAVLPEIDQAARIAGGYIEDVVFTPDFHKGAGIPIGTVLKTHDVIFPKAVGSDIGCRMNLCVLDVTKDEFVGCLNQLRPVLRHMFYQGGRNVALSVEQREAIMRHGMTGLLECSNNDGLLGQLSKEVITAHINSSLTEQMPTSNLWSFSNYVKGSGGVSRLARAIDILQKTLQAMGLHRAESITLVPGDALKLKSMLVPSVVMVKDKAYQDETLRICDTAIRDEV